jgi:nucleoside-diphosphate-sugar epimerase
LEVASRTGLEVVIVRPPLVYGPGVKGNFPRFVNLVRRGWPLPLASVQNKRSLVALGNLVDLLIVCIDHPRAVGRTFFVSDGHDLSTPDLLRHIAQAMNRPSRMFPVPSGILRTGAALLGAKAEAERLLGSLQVDIRETCDLLGWAPPVSIDHGLRAAVTGA